MGDPGPGVPGRDAEPLCADGDRLAGQHDRLPPGWGAIDAPDRIVVPRPEGQGGAAGSFVGVTVLYSCEEVFGEHLTGRGHPERPARLDAVDAGIAAHHLRDLLLPIEGRPATDDELQAVHPPEYLATIERFCANGGGHIDSDTVLSSRSEELARRGSGILLSAIERLSGGLGTAAFVAVRPPGHHATSDVAMGFCVYNHIAVAAAKLREGGERVVVVDIDAHHGNGTQDIFFDEPGVLYVSWHQSPHYPYSGGVHESGGAGAPGTTINVPLPAGATGEHYRRSIAELVAPAIESFGADWMLISAGFDAHRSDPLCDLALTSGDVGDITADLRSLVPTGRVAALLEGGYDLNALADCSAAMVASLGGVQLHPEAPTSGGPGSEFVDVAVEARHRLGG